MALSDYAPKSETVTFPGGEFTVRGLSLQDLTVLLRTHYATANALFDRYIGESAMAAATAKSPEIATGDPREVVLEALEVAPGMISDVVARAADEPDKAALVARLPLGVQVEAIEAVVRLTLEAEGGLEKFVETVLRLTGSLASVPVDRST